MPSGEGGRDDVPFRCSRWYSFVPLNCAFSLLRTCRLTTNAADALKVCNVAMYRVEPSCPRRHDPEEKQEKLQNRREDKGKTDGQKH